MRTQRQIGTVLEKLCAHPDISRHFDCGTGHFPITLRIVQVTNRQTAAIHETGKIDRNTRLQIAYIHVAAMLSGRNRSQAGFRRSAPGSAQCLRVCVVSQWQ